MIEFAILVPLLIILLVIIADFGRITAWMQQIAYAADAGAQYAYEAYEPDDIVKAFEKNGNFDSIKTKIISRVRAAVNNPAIDDALVSVQDVWRCRWVEYDAGYITLRYSDALTGSDLDAARLNTFSDCDDDDRGFDCGGEDCSISKPALLIEVTVTAEFQPLTPFIERLFDSGILPANLSEQVFSSEWRILKN